MLLRPIDLNTRQLAVADPNVNFVKKETKSANAPTVAPIKKMGSKVSVVPTFIVVSQILIFGGGFFAVKSMIDHRRAEEAAKAIPKETPLPDPTFRLAPISTNVQAEPESKVLEITVNFEIENEKTRTELTVKEAFIRDDLMMLFSSKKAGDLNGSAQTHALQNEILGRINRILSHGQIKSVFFSDFLIRDIATQ
ncbi:MAG: flagellar basal body-associated protein FliL [Bacteriovoracaceae bacterium]|nr:flagellar basal body-associated protein FliL [Bacteriovoracaceae bacterium]